MQHIKFLPFLLLLFLANCKSPVAPQGTARITYFSPRDTTLSDSRRVVFHFKIDDPNPGRSFLEWHFSDSSSDKISTSIQSYNHTFPGLGIYTFSVLLLDTISKNRIDTVSGTIRTVQSPPSTSELQKMNYFKIQVYCPVRTSCYSIDTSSTSRYLFDIDPLTGPMPKYSLKKEQAYIKWNGGSFSLSYSHSFIDTNYASPPKNGLTVIVSGKTSLQLNGSLNPGNSNIDSAILSYSYQYDYNELSHPSTESVHESENISINLISLAWLYRTNDSLIYQVSGNELSQIIKNTSWDFYSFMYGPTTSSHYCGPFWNPPNIFSSYARIIFYK